MAYDEAQQQLLVRSDQLAASRFAVESAELRHDALRHLGGPVIGVSGATYAYNASLNVDLGPVSQSLTGVLAQLPAPLRQTFAALPSLPPSYTLNQSATGTTGAVSGVWPLYTGGAVQAARNLMDERTHEAQADADQTGEEVQGLLVQRYFGAQLARRAASLRAAALVSIEQHDQAAQKMLDAGVISRVERLQAQVALEDARKQSRKADDDAELAIAALTRTIKGQDRVTPTSALFVSSQPVAPLAQFIEVARLHHPGLSKVMARKGQAEQLHAAEEALRRPQVFAFGEHEIKSGRQANWVAGIGVHWTLYDAIDRKTMAEATQRDVLQAERMYAQVQGDIELLVEKRWLALEQARRAYLAQSPGVMLASEVLHLRQAGLKAGTSTPLDLIDAELNQAKVNTERAQAAYEYVKALAELLASCGQTADFTQYMARADIKVE
jgi:outer membrane protein TolC